ncbi:MAG: D-hexose-6-phosphate mutarotase [Proteobacteria bacterium]|nr:D-hexose-6-phosphate mutarotase [Pseudomonadota bacterium]
MEINNKNAHAKIALQGAHLFHYQRLGHAPLLWLSEKSFFEAGKAIRGGVPICWPWFGRHKTEKNLPQHGFARNVLWKLLEARENDACSTEITLQLTSSEESLQLWPHRFELLLQVTVSETLCIALTSKNCDKTTCEISSALHSYFAVTNIDNVSVEGLENTLYFDAVTNESKTQKGPLFITEEVDRIYQKVHNPLILHDQTRTVHIAATGSSSAVVWNPWITKCANMNDMQDIGYQTMLCIETANALEDARQLAPGEEHTLTAVIS